MPKHTNALLGSTLFTISSCLALPGAAQPANQAQAAAATDSAFAITVGGGHTDNVRRSASNEESDEYSLVGVTGQYARTGPRLDTSVAANIEQRNYSRSDIEDEPYGNVTANLDVYAVPERIYWSFSDSYGQARIDPFDALGPFNQEQINIFSTGPRFDVPLGDRTLLAIAATRSTRSFEETDDLESDTESGSLALSRALSTTTMVGLTAESRRIEYDATMFETRISSAYLSYERTLASGSAQAAVGTSRADFGAADTSAPYVSLNWNRDVATRSNIAVSITNQLSDIGDTFVQAPGEIPISPEFDNTLLSADVFEETSAALTYTLTLPRTQLTVGGRRVEAGYENETALDYDWVQWTFSLNRTLSPRMTLTFNAATARRDFGQVGRSDSDQSARLGLQRSFAERFSLNVEYLRNSRSGGIQNEFDENVFRLRVSYRLNRAGAANPAAVGQP